MADRSPDSIVATSNGPVRGSVEDGVTSWKGVPFAAPPTGHLRWRAPQPVERWSDVLDATDFRSDCMQLPYGPAAFNMRTTPSEDCLYLNVWKPADARENLPVLVWIYGGGWVIGGTSAPIYSGKHLAERGLVVVSLNYRLGHFGFFAHPQLTRENADGGLFFNYGILDQVAALKWIRQNISAFGGNADNITVMGESAGGVSVHALTTSPLNDGLFHKAIIMSGADGDDLGSGKLADAETLGVNLARRKGIEADDPQALMKLKALPAEEIVDGLTFGSPPRRPQTFNGGGPIEDGKIVADVGASYASGKFQRIPMIVGATADDLGGRTGFMVAGARRFASRHAERGVPVYQYRFSYVPSASPVSTAVHAIDIPFFMQTLPSLYGSDTEPKDEALALVIGGYIEQFANTDTFTPELGNWPKFDDADDLIMDFSSQGTAVVVKDPWAKEIDAAPEPRYPGLDASEGP